LKGNALARFARSRRTKSPAVKQQFAKRPTNPSRLFWQAGGGLELRSNSQMKFVSNFFLSVEGGIRSQFLIPRFTCPPLADGQRRPIKNL
jgi:hypothetical protein